MTEDVVWRKSSRSNGSRECVEIAFFGNGTVGVRDSKDRSGPVLRFTAGEWDAFMGGVSNIQPD